MKTTLITLLIIVASASLAVVNYKKTQSLSVLKPNCYVANDKHKLQITSTTNGRIDGALEIHNSQKDSSSGTIVGTYQDGILLVDYTFRSEGSTSTSQLVFKKSGDNFLQGYGDMDESGTHFANLNQIHYDNSPIFTLSDKGCIK